METEYWASRVLSCQTRRDYDNLIRELEKERDKAETHNEVMAFEKAITDARCRRFMAYA